MKKEEIGNELFEREVGLDNFRDVSRNTGFFS